MSNSDPHPFRLHVLGAPDLRAPDGRRVTSVLSQPKRLGLLTYLALAEGPVTRSSLVALFWPESDEARARNALSQAVFYLRRSLAERVVESVEGDRLWVPPEHVWCDARELLRGEGHRELAALGDLLEGWNAEDSQELQEWLDTQRRRLRERVADVAPAARPAPAPPRRPQNLPRAGRLAAVTALAVLVGVVVTTSLVSDRLQGVEAPASGSLAVLLPQVSAGPGAPTVDAAALHAELLAALPHSEGVRIVSANYAGSLQDFRRQLAALGVAAAEVPTWILEVSVRATDTEARAIGLLHRSPAFDLPGRVSFDVTYASPEAALLEAPQEVARGVSRMVEEVLAGERR